MTMGNFWGPRSSASPTEKVKPRGTESSIEREKVAATERTATASEAIAGARDIHRTLRLNLRTP